MNPTDPTNSQVDGSRVDLVSAVVVHQPQPLDVSQAMRIEDILGQVRLIQEVMRKVMVEKEHYGTIPGCGDKKTLLQPGAQKLTMTFRLAPEYNIQEVNLERGHKEYRITCTLKSIQSGSFVGQGVGCCSTMESKYRWRGGARKCPDCGKETIIKGKAEYGGGWLCFAKKGGCGAKWPDGAQEIESQSAEKVENDNPADSYNTVLKIAKKRAFVDATIMATAASDIFTQDIGEDDSPRSEYVPDASERFEDAPQRAEAPKPSQDSNPAPKTTPEGKQTPTIGPKYRLQTLNKLQAAPGQPRMSIVEGYLRSKGWISGQQNVTDFPLDKLPRDIAEFQDLYDAVHRFETTTRE